MTTLIERIAFKRIRLKPNGAYRAGDTKIFDSVCQNYRIQFVRRAYGVAMTPHYHALRAVGRLGNQTRWHKVATCKTFAAAARALGLKAILDSSCRGSVVVSSDHDDTKTRRRPNSDEGITDGPLSASAANADDRSRARRAPRRKV